jgi:peroxiredoxin
VSRSGALAGLLIVGAVVVAVGAFVTYQGSSSLPLRVGAPAPPFSRADLEGREIALETLRGRVVFVNFWATWCPPCRTEAPALERLYQELRQEGFEILALSIDEPGARSEVDSFQREFGLSFPVLLDPGKEAYQAYQATGVPETFMVDPQGRMVERFVGPREWDDPRYARAIRRLLSAAPEEASGG